MQVKNVIINEEIISAENLIKRIREGKLGEIVQVVFTKDKERQGKLQMKLVDINVNDSKFISLISP